MRYRIRRVTIPRFVSFSETTSLLIKLKKPIFFPLANERTRSILRSVRSAYAFEKYPQMSGHFSKTVGSPMNAYRIIAHLLLLDFSISYLRYD